MGEEDSGVRGHRAAPGRIVDVVAAAVDAAVLGRLVALRAVRRGAGFTERGAVQAQGRYVTGAIVLVQAESAGQRGQRVKSNESIPIGGNFHSEEKIRIETL